MSLRWYEGSATATTRTIIAEVIESVDYHLVIGQTLATLVRVSEEKNTALACGDSDEMRARAEAFAASEKRPREERPGMKIERYVFEPPARETEPPARETALSAADMINDLPKIDEIEAQVDGMIKS